MQALQDEHCWLGYSSLARSPVFPHCRDTTSSLQKRLAAPRNPLTFCTSYFHHSQLGEFGSLVNVKRFNQLWFKVWNKRILFPRTLTHPCVLQFFPFYSKYNSQNALLELNHHVPTAEHNSLGRKIKCHFSPWVRDAVNTEAWDRFAPHRTSTCPQSDSRFPHGTALCQFTEHEPFITHTRKDLYW